jgi:hypothetical protein
MTFFMRPDIALEPGVGSTEVELDLVEPVGR